MATEAAHKLRADGNQAFLKTISDDFPDWLATVAFYRAVHLVEMLFARDGIHSHTHSERNRRLKKRYPRVWMEFKPLLDASKLARYTDSSIPAAVVRTELIKRRLRAVERLVNRELAKVPGRKK